MKIKVLGTECAKYDTAEKIVKEAVVKSGIDAKVVKISDRMEIARPGVLITPAVIIGDEVKLAGKIPEKDKVINWIENYAAN